MAIPYPHPTAAREGRVVIFGTGPFGECARFLFDHDSNYEVVAYTASRDRLEGDSKDGLPLVPFEELEELYPPASFKMFVAVGYLQMNRVRARYYQEAKDKGYELVSYVSSRATWWGESIGDNSFVFEDNTVQPFSRIGNDVVLWSGNHIGHHAVIEDHCFLSSHVVVSGKVRVGAYSFLGVNATLRDEITLGESTLVGAGALIMKDTAPRSLFIPRRTKPDPRTVDDIQL